MASNFTNNYNEIDSSAARLIWGNHLNIKCHVSWGVAREGKRGTVFRGIPLRPPAISTNFLPHNIISTQGSQCNNLYRPGGPVNWFMTTLIAFILLVQTVKQSQIPHLWLLQLKQKSVLMHMCPWAMMEACRHVPARQLPLRWMEVIGLRCWHAGVLTRPS